MTTEYENPLILIHDKKISNMQDIVPILEKAVGTPVVRFLIIAEDIESQALGVLVVNRLQSTAESRCRKSSWLWRPPQSDAGRYRYPHRRYGNL